MTTTTIEREMFVEIDTGFYQEQIGKVIDFFIPQFNRMVKGYVAFHALFITMIVLEVILIGIFLPQLTQSFMLSFGLALLFLTFCTYFILRSYLQTRKPQQIQELSRKFVKSCQHLINYQEGVADHHAALANACCRLDSRLRGKEYRYYRPPRWMEFLSHTMEGISSKLYWRDVHQFREALLLISIEEHIRLVKCEPTNLEVHATLANAYVMLSGLYADPRTTEGYDEDHWVSPERSSEVMQKKFRTTASRAIEEFKILNDYAPDDPWVHAQLAYSYHDLNMPKEEIHEYETILALCPGDLDTLFKLGTLYFQQGFNAKGLKVYERLKSSHYKKAESLIQHYGSY